MGNKRRPHVRVNGPQLKQIMGQWHIHDDMGQEGHCMGTTHGMLWQSRGDTVKRKLGKTKFVGNGMANTLNCAKINLRLKGMYL